MEGISIVRLPDNMVPEGAAPEYVTNLTNIRQKIVRLFGKTACGVYQVIPENEGGTLGM